jgi:hypothetical protein
MISMYSGGAAVVSFLRIEFYKDWLGRNCSLEAINTNSVTGFVENMCRLYMHLHSLFHTRDADLPTSREVPAIKQFIFHLFEMPDPC